jgi:hypothetical protein
LFIGQTREPATDPVLRLPCVRIETASLQMDDGVALSGVQGKLRQLRYL